MQMITRLHSHYLMAFEFQTSHTKNGAEQRLRVMWHVCLTSELGRLVRFQVRPHFEFSSYLQFQSA